MTQRPDPSIHVLHNARTGQTLETSPRPHDWFAHNLDKLGVAATDRPGGLSWKEGLKAACDAGWVGIGCFDGNIFLSPVRLADIPSALAKALELGAATPVSLGCWTPETGYVNAEGDDFTRLIGEQRVDHLLGDLLENNAAINGLLDEMRALPFAKEITVFGSVATGKPFPRTLDAALNLRHCADPGEAGTIWRKMAQGDKTFLVAYDLAGLMRPDEYGGWASVSSRKTLGQTIRSDGRPLAAIRNLETTPHNWTPEAIRARAMAELGEADDEKSPRPGF